MSMKFSPKVILIEKNINFCYYSSMEYVICHYSEIGLKGKNRKFFEEKLIEQIKRCLDCHFYEFVKRISGRIIIKLNQRGIKEQSEIRNALKNVFGLAYFCFASEVEQNIESIKKQGLKILKQKDFNSFRIFTKRSKKDFYLTSPEIDRQVGGYIVDNLKKKVDLENSEIVLFIEIVEKYAFLYVEKIKGQGGLPVGVSGKVLLLLSGGIDSPVAGFQLIKRGLKLAFVHFHTYPYTTRESIEKTEKIVKHLSKFQGKSKFYLVPFAEIQKQIVLKVPVKLRVIFYRRLMVRIAQEIAKKENILVLATGDNLGQVASQTLKNINVITKAVDMPILRPLITFDKEEIVNKAKEIDTYKISILPDQDCCSRFVPKHPETGACLKDVNKAEKKLKIKKLFKITLKQVEISKIV